jgi:hypothetical protein
MPLDLIPQLIETHAGVIAEFAKLAVEFCKQWTQVSPSRPSQVRAEIIAVNGPSIPLRSVVARRPTNQFFELRRIGSRFRTVCIDELEIEFACGRTVGDAERAQMIDLLQSVLRPDVLEVAPNAARGTFAPCWLEDG